MAPAKLLEYDNYRFFLRDLLAEKKTLQPHFSLRAFSLRCGFASHSFLVHLLKGERNLSLESIEQILPALSLSGKEANYFRTLVQYNQATSAANREKYLKELIRQREGAFHTRLQKDQWEYYRYWYLPVLRELAVASPWLGDYGKLGKLVRPAISAKEAKDGVDLLVRIGLLKKMASGQFKLQNQVVSAEGVPGVVFRSVRSEYMLRALEAAEILPKEERHASYAVMGTSREAFVRISAKLDDLRKELLSAYAEQGPVECVFAVNLQAFPVSQVFPSSRKSMDKPS